VSEGALLLVAPLPKLGGRDGMIKPSIRLQDLRWGIYAKQKAETTGIDGVGSGGANPRRGTARTERTASLLGHINLGEKPAGQPSAGNLHAGLRVQLRLACSTGDSPVGVKARSPVARIAGWRETEILKPIDSAI